jgi:hypothetical protein
MASNYGSRFEALVADACKDFGAKLIRSWDQGADKAEIRAFVDEAVKTFFALDAASGARASSLAPPPPPPSEPDEESAVASPPPPAPAPKAKGKAKATTKGKGKAPTKPKCQALTAKGAPCSKCAVEGSTFCSVHNAVTTKAKGKAPAPAKTAAKPKGKGGRGLAKRDAPRTPPPPPASVKHTHGLDELDHEDCDLCKSHGAPFELPDYEAGTSSSVPAPAPNKKTWADDAEDEEDPTYDPLAEEEEDASEIGSDGGGGGLSEEDFDEDY